MLVKLSSKGQLVIPRALRQSMGLESGMRFNLQRRGRTLILEPLDQTFPIDALYGKYPALDLLSDLEHEHSQELERDKALRS